MAQTPPVQPGQVSPDGLWRWDGSRWVPTMTAPPHRSRAWIWWLAGGCALLLVIGLVAAGIGVYSLARNIQSSGFGLNCLPSDFPSYPGATVTTAQVNYGAGVAPGDSRVCQVKLESTDDVATVTTFYTARLNSGDWKVTAVISSVGQIQFHRVSRDQTVGLVQLLGRGQHTEIIIQLSS